MDRSFDMPAARGRGGSGLGPLRKSSDDVMRVAPGSTLVSGRAAILKAAGTIEMGVLYVIWGLMNGVTDMVSGPPVVGM